VTGASATIFIMQLAVLADIHGNALALEAVLEHAHHSGLREFVDLGDVLYGPLEPKRTFGLLQSVRLVAGVSGNQDRYVANATGQQRLESPTLDFVVRDLGPEPLAWLKSLPQTAKIDGELLLFHGSPASDTEYLLEDVSTGKPVVRPEEAILSLLGQGRKEQVFLCGHTHVPRLVNLAGRDGALVINPGSVGLPAYDDGHPVPHWMECYSPHACYAVIERSARTSGWNVTFHRVVYDWKAAAKQARSLGRQDWAQGIEFGRMG
jgi:predicted phosphodiesterase